MKNKIVKKIEERTKDNTDENLYQECKARGFNVTYFGDAFNGTPLCLWGDYKPNKMDFEISLPTDQVNSVVYTSPDWHEGVQIELDYTTSNGRCTIEIPYLEYCGMLIIE